MSITVNCSFSSVDSPCNETGIGSRIIPLMACTADMQPHFESLGISSGKRPRTALEISSESGLILNRAGHFDLTMEQKAGMTICPKHRKYLTTSWAGRKSFSCSYPTHKGPRKSLRNPRRGKPYNVNRDI